eukprot:TRINITY_DN7171_c0_g1_i1.p1 TRINITY_DN7171_c0_g1~~TRINITY_DN7171_c0_g1_i1.p1  ORF type:complete len:297 (-),score=53.49 TRINITY_DN7171_c0_g1_i1:235-1125(-)
MSNETTNLSHNRSSSNTRPFRKILYEQQSNDDTYFDPSLFLAGLRVNENFTEFVLTEEIRDSHVVSRQVALAVLFVAIFVGRMSGWISSNQFSTLITTFISVIVIISCFFFHDLTNLCGAIKWLVFIAVLYVASPLIMTLTLAISEDTIVLSVAYLLLWNVIFADYSYMTFVSESFSGQSSMTAAISAGLLLSSRLPSSHDVFLFLLLSLAVFAWFPFLIRSIQAQSPSFDRCISFVFVTFGMCGTFACGSIYFILYITIIAFVSIAAPFTLTRLQDCKMEIHGPWDEAVLKPSAI